MDTPTHMILMALLTAITSSGFMSLVIYLLQRSDKKREIEDENESVQSRMILGLGHDKLIYLTDKFVRRGSITLKEKRNLEYLYKPYADMGGNGDCKIGYDACQRLPVVSDDEASMQDIEIKRKEFNIGTE